MKRTTIALTSMLLLATISKGQEVAGKSPWGKDDEIGTLNMMTAESRLQALDAIKAGKVYDLSVEYFVGMPGFNMMGDPTYQYWLTHTPRGTINDNPNWQGEQMNRKVSYTSDAISMFTHTGTHIDALNHFGLEGKIWNEFSADENLGDKGWKKAGAETIPPIVARGVLIDVAAYKGVAVLEKNYRITSEDLKGSLRKQGVQLKAGDVILIRTGQARLFEEAGKYVDHYPGVSFEAIQWLVETQKIMIIGADNLGLEAFPSERKDNWVPVHSYLLAQKGMMFMEQLFLEELSAEKVYEFAFIGAPLKLRGASGSPLRPLALPYYKQ
ncbi:MAG: cyclase family protein [Bacteroidota bacterium]